MKKLILTFIFSMASVHAMQQADQGEISAYLNALKALNEQFKDLSDKSNPTSDEINNLDAQADAIHMKYARYSPQEVEIQQVRAYIKDLTLFNQQCNDLSDKSNPTHDEINNLYAQADAIYIKYENYSPQQFEIQHVRASIDRHWVTIIQKIKLAHQRAQATHAFRDLPLCLSDLDDLEDLDFCLNHKPSANRYILQEQAFERKTAFFRKSTDEETEK
jgi:predicted  nucleic acid-binding Zn-ribbon protein